MQTVRFVVRVLGSLLASLLVVSASLLTVVHSAQAAIGRGQQQSLRTTAADSPPLTISITGMSPTTAGPNSTITVRGTLANHTGSTMTGITVQAMTSFQLFQYPAQMTQYTATTRSGASALALQQAGSPYQITTSVRSGATAVWSVTFPASAFYTTFGVYPIQVQATAAGGTDAANARTFLPYWPGGSAGRQVKGLQVAWVWPLIDAPQQGACPGTLATSELSSSVTSGGRLSTLLDEGAAWAKTDQLTWDIDPALLSDVSVMTHSYYTHGSAVCSGRFTESASPAAKQWLTTLATSTAGESAFLSPYANVDVAALTHSGLDQDIASAYRLGEMVSGQVLPGTFGKKGTGTGDGAVLKAASPADGKADAGVLTSLATDGRVNTVVLSSTELPPTGIGENAQVRTVNSVGTSMSVLAANAGITSLLGTASTRSQTGEFALTQDFLAQTAMIASEAPSESRSLVIAPPTGWDPSPGVANTLLATTNRAPWLDSTGLSTLASEAARLPATTRVPAKQVSSAELSDGYLDSLDGVRSSLSLFKNLLYQPSPGRLNSLDGALATAESSAWRGSASPGAWRAATQLKVYLKDSLTDVQIIASKKLLLAGQSGEALVSVVNHLHEPVQVKVMATPLLGSQLTVSTADPLLTVQAGGTNSVRMSVHSGTLGTTTLQLQLATQDGSPLTWTTQPLSVEVTRIGRSLLIIIGAALGILVLTSAYRLRRKRLARARNGGSADRTADAGGAG